MKKSRRFQFFGLLFFILFASIGKSSMAHTGLGLDTDEVVIGEIQRDHQLNYNVQFSVYEMLLAQGNQELPAVNELRPDLNLIYPSSISSLSILNEKVLMSLKKYVHITASLDALTIIYPFHTFL